MFTRFARMAMVAALATLAPLGVSPKEATAAPAVRADAPKEVRIRFKTKAAADKKAKELQFVGYITEVYADDSGYWFVHGTLP